MNLADCIGAIVRRWSFNGERYKAWNRLDEAGRRVFAMKHALDHQVGAVLHLNNHFSAFEHRGVVFDEELVRHEAIKMVVNALRFAELAGITAEELEASFSRPSGG